MNKFVRVAASVACALALVSCGVQGSYDSTKELRESFLRM